MCITNNAKVLLVTKTLIKKTLFFSGSVFENFFF